MNGKISTVIHAVEHTRRVEPVLTGHAISDEQARDLYMVCNDGSKEVLMAKLNEMKFYVISTF